MNQSLRDARRWRFLLPRFGKRGAQGLGLADLFESELDALMKDPSRPHEMRLDAFEEILRRERRAADLQRRDEDEEYRNIDWPVA